MQVDMDKDYETYAGAKITHKDGSVDVIIEHCDGDGSLIDRAVVKFDSDGEEIFRTGNQSTIDAILTDENYE